MKRVSTNRGHRSGSALVLALFVITLLGILIGLAFDHTTSTARVTRRAADYSRAQSVANGMLEIVFKRWQVYMSAKQASALASYATKAKFKTLTDSLQAPVQAFAASAGYTVTALIVEPVDRADNAVATQDAAYGFFGPLDNAPKWKANNWSYHARASITKIGDPTFNVSVSRYFHQSDASLYQAMLFFEDDLELHPGPAMTLYGLVHTNSNMYAAAGSGGSLTFASNVSYVGNPSTFPDSYASNYSRPFFDINGYVEGVTKTLAVQESSNWGNFKIPVYSSDANTQVAHSNQLSRVATLSPIGTTDPVVIAGNGNASGTHEIIERPVPSSRTDPNPKGGLVDPPEYASHRAYNDAGLRIFIDRTQSQPVQVYVQDPSNVEKSIRLTAGDGSPSKPLNIVNKIIDAITPAAGIPTKGEITDFREGNPVNVSTVDVSKLTPALNSYSDYNGVIFIADITNADSAGNTSDTDAIRLKKGGTLPDTGMTVVTDGALYVQGDYNTGTTYAPLDVNGRPVPVLQPATNLLGDPSLPSDYNVGTYRQKPAALMGDAVMVLSNAWQDSNSPLALASRIATPTTFNAAIVSGAVITTDTAASGGAHNFPRFLEDWSSKAFTYHGSMCELYESTHFTGTYGHGNVYSAPVRRWYFDDNFLLNPPPGNLRTTKYSRGRWVRDNSSSGNS